MAAFVETGTILDRILAKTAQDVYARSVAKPIAELERMAAGRPAPVSLAAALTGPGIAVIAEFKRASPSKGRFPLDARPADVAAQYFEGGAAAISVLTDEPFFQGSLADLREAAGIAHGFPKPSPVLRKDFVVDEYQIVEALAHGADAILLIVSALDQRTLERLSGLARRNGLDALVEVHDVVELARAEAAGALLIGINNRNLHTFEVDLAITERLAPLAASGSIVVSESGIFTADDVRRVHSVGANAILVGESLITATNHAAAVRLLRDAVSVAADDRTR
jgi:indole-3-glycerol phosphate synthase